MSINPTRALVNSSKRPSIRDLNDLANMPRWVAWRLNTSKDEEGKPRRDKRGEIIKIKTPYDPNVQWKKAQSNNPATWNTRAKAERRCRQINNGKLNLGSQGGVGIVLGDLGNGYHLLGIDLDSCVTKLPGDGIDVDDLPNEVIERFGSYAERSPSGKGIKIFFLVASTDMDAVQELLGFEDDKPKTRKTFAAGKHREMALDRERYYCITDQYVDDNLEFRVVDVADIRWFIEDAGPRFKQIHGTADVANDNTSHSRDESGSGWGYRFFGNCKAHRMSFGEAWEAIMKDSSPAGDWARRIENRQLERAWARCPVRACNDFKQPKTDRRKIPLIMTARMLETQTFPPIKFVVPDILVEGLSIFAGKPKVGKSWLMLNVATAVAVGGDTLGGIHCEQGDVLYGALEDNPRRMQSRMRQMKVRPGWSKHLQFCYEMPRLNEGGVDVIRDWVRKVKRPRLVIIDTFKRVRAHAVKGVNETQYDSDYDAVAELQALATECGIAIVIVHHQRKMDAEDPFDTVSGTLGLTGAADTIMILQRESTGAFTLRARGRDISEIEKAMAFNRETCRWKITGEAAEVRRSKERVAIIQAMQEINEPASTQKIAQIAECSPANVSKLLVKMARDGTVHQHGYGKYALEPEGARGFTPDRPTDRPGTDLTRRSDLTD